MKLREIEKILNEKLERDSAESWDNCGLLIGRRYREISNILIALELTPEVLVEAKDKKCDMILTHHPAIFSGLKQIVDDANDNLVFQAIQLDIAVYSAHTNFDIIVGGLNDYVASLLGASTTTVLDINDERIIRLFDIEQTSFDNFIINIKKALEIDTLRVIGNPKETISRVGMVTGSGGDYAKDAFDYGADVFITGDVKYHEAMEFKHQAYTVIDAGHFETEKFFPAAMKGFIEKNISQIAARLITSEVEQSPFIYYSETKNNANNSDLPKNIKDKDIDIVKDIDEANSKSKIVDLTGNIEIYTDGGSRGNPGDAAIGYAIKSNGENVYQYAQNIGIQTNNVAEYQAVLSALQKAKELGIGEFTLYLDSQLVERQLNGTYKVKNEDLKVLYDQIMVELKTFKNYKIVHVKRELNKLADKLVNMALDQQKTIEIKEI